MISSLISHAPTITASAACAGKWKYSATVSLSSRSEAFDNVRARPMPGASIPQAYENANEIVQYGDM